MSNLLDAALDYAHRGWHVFPLHNMTENGVCSCGRTCNSPAKHPRVAKGFKAATANPEIIVEWWREWPEANVGIATGRVSKLVVIDVDGAAGLAEVARLKGEGILFTPTLIALTGRGFHFYYTYGRDKAIKCSIGNGLDVRGDGGYVVAPPSVHSTGAIYQWRRA